MSVTPAKTDNTPKKEQAWDKIIVSDLPDFSEAGIVPITTEFSDKQRQMASKDRDVALSNNDKAQAERKTLVVEKNGFSNAQFGQLEQIRIMSASEDNKDQAQVLLKSFEKTNSFSKDQKAFISDYVTGKKEKELGQGKISSDMKQAATAAVDASLSQPYVPNKNNGPSTATALAMLRGDGGIKK